MASGNPTLSAVSIAGGISRYGAEIAIGEYQNSMLNINAMFTDLSAKDAIIRGEKESSRVRKQAGQLIGKQRTALAAQGIELDEGTALDIQEDTAELGASDAMTVRNNAWREAWGMRVQASNLRSQARLAKINAKSRGANTLLTSGASAFQSIGV